MWHKLLNHFKTLMNGGIAKIGPVNTSVVVNPMNGRTARKGPVNTSVVANPMNGRTARQRSVKHERR